VAEIAAKVKKRQDRKTRLSWFVRANELYFDQNLRLSFQRCILPPGGVHPRPPSSLGRLPVAFAGTEFLLPLASAESFWIGITRLKKNSALACGVETVDRRFFDTASGKELSDLATMSLLPAHEEAIDGILRPDGGCWAFAAPAAAYLAIRCSRIIVQSTAPRRHDYQRGQIVLVDYAEFHRATGRSPPDPLNESAGYKGWLLP
jgi:hypothetical protein